MEFDEILKRRLRKITETLGNKELEYAQAGNRFHNFDVAAQRRGITPEKALDGMMLKHEVSVSDLINSPNNVTQELIDEKIGDNINYLILLEGLLNRRL